MEKNYCDYCEFAYLCYGVDTEHCESYKAIMKSHIEKEKEG